jgi:predicted nucleotidyltransferase component of viral defense system
MKLHLDKAAFETLILDIAEKTNIRADIIEKDYYVTLLLEELANKQSDLPAFFKGGTALYKALGSIRRFSEDIDLTVSVDDCSNTQAKKRLSGASTEYTSLNRNKEDADNDNRKGSITCIYNYDSVVDVDINDSLQRFGRVKIEATSFTVSEPVESMKIASIIFDKATKEQKQLLTDIYDVDSFEIHTIKLERIFIDKIFAAEFYYLRNGYFDVAKHLYDIVVLLQNDRIQSMLNDGEMLNHMIEYKRKEEHLRIGSELSEKPIKDFAYLNQAITNDEFVKEFKKMQEIYVFDDSETISIKELKVALEKLNIVAKIDEDLDKSLNESMMTFGV